MSHIIILKNSFDDSLTQYGDGIFETMLCVGTDIVHWDYHWDRLRGSCKRLAISAPDDIKLYEELQSQLSQSANVFSVVKIIVSRGEGLRGYRSHSQQPCFVQFAISPFHSSQPNKELNVRICKARLSHQPLLAGMKHLNRLEYVMARRECEDAKFDEGLLLNYDNDVIEGLVSNLFMINNGQIYTPDVSGSGVAGTMRAYLLENLASFGFMVTVQRLAMRDITSADEIFLTNATNGIMPVAAIQAPDSKKMIYLENTITNSIRQLVDHPCSEI